jgi:squalene-associated FAD-dependent desaturase
MDALTAYEHVIVGAGFAGLSAAVRLARHGSRVLVLERRARLGGRATTFPDRETGDLVDNGQHVLLGCYVETFAFLREIGALDHVKVQPQLSLTVVDRAGARSRLVCPVLPSPLHLLAGVLDWGALGWRDRWSVRHMAAPLRLARRQLGGARLLAASPGETVEAWLVRNGQTPRVRELLWDPLALAALNQPAHEAAAPTFVRVLAEMFGPDPRAAAIALPVRPLHLMYAEPARAYVEARGGSVRTAAAARILQPAGGPLTVEAAGERWTPRAVVCAVPWFSVADVLDGSLAPLSSVVDLARRMRSSPIVTVNLWFDRQVMEESPVGLPGRRMQWVFDTRDVLGGAAPHLSLVSSGATPLLRMQNHELVAMAHEELRAALPAVGAARLVRAAVVRELRATFSLAPGQPPRPDTATPVEGLFLAGDWIDTGLPATIESAVRSGHRAADAVFQFASGFDCPSPEPVSEPRGWRPGGAPRLARSPHQ